MFYAGSYKAENRKTTHCITLSSDPELIVTNQVRLVQFEGDRLPLTVPESMIGGPGTRAEIIWRRAG